MAPIRLRQGFVPPPPAPSFSLSLISYSVAREFIPGVISPLLCRGCNAGVRINLAEWLCVPSSSSGNYFILSLLALISHQPPPHFPHPCPFLSSFCSQLTHSPGHSSSTAAVAPSTASVKKSWLKGVWLFPALPPFKEKLNWIQTVMDNESERGQF